jgi:hypothetical protein
MARLTRADVDLIEQLRKLAHDAPAGGSWDTGDVEGVVTHAIALIERLAWTREPTPDQPSYGDLRDRFAANALIGLLSWPLMSVIPEKGDLAKWAYELADEMLQTRRPA